MDHIFALLILSVALLGLVALASTVIGANASSRTRTEALTLVQDKLEDMRRVGYNYVPVTSTTVTEPYGSLAGAPLYKRVTTVQPNTPALGLQTITVTVYWAADTRSLSSSVLLGR
ncbi:MAG: type IV pilus modification PilV family protein [Nitrospiraceae bacterium]